MADYFLKPSTSLEEQINLLRRRGMHIEDDAVAFAALKRASYYRLSAYWHVFRDSAHQEESRYFKEGTCFSHVITLYGFDGTLRRLIMEAVEVIEVSVRANWTQQMAMLGSPHAYLDASHYKATDTFSTNKERLIKEANASKETFIKHYMNKYDSPALPPVWMAAEILSFGSLSRWYSNLKEKALRQRIADPFNLDEKVFKTYIHHISVIRNTCAHHGRLWNREINATLILPKRPHEVSQSVNRDKQGRIYNTVTMLAYGMERITQETNWNQRIAELFTQHASRQQLHSMGFPEMWQDTPMWKHVI